MRVLRSRLGSEEEGSGGDGEMERNEGARGLERPRV